MPALRYGWLFGFLPVHTAHRHTVTVTYGCSHYARAAPRLPVAGCPTRTAVPFPHIPVPAPAPVYYTQFAVVTAVTFGYTTDIATRVLHYNILHGFTRLHYLYAVYPLPLPAAHARLVTTLHHRLPPAGWLVIPVVRSVGLILPTVTGWFAGCILPRGSTGLHIRSGSPAYIRLHMVLVYAFTHAFTHRMHAHYAVGLRFCLLPVRFFTHTRIPQFTRLHTRFTAPIRYRTHCCGCTTTPAYTARAVAFTAVRRLYTTLTVLHTHTRFAALRSGLRLTLRLRTLRLPLLPLRFFILMRLPLRLLYYRLQFARARLHIPVLLRLRVAPVLRLPHTFTAGLVTLRLRGCGSSRSGSRFFKLRYVHIHLFMPGSHATYVCTATPHTRFGYLHTHCCGWLYGCLPFAALPAFGRRATVILRFTARFTARVLRLPLRFLRLRGSVTTRSPPFTGLRVHLVGYQHDLLLLYPRHCPHTVHHVGSLHLRLPTAVLVARLRLRGITAPHTTVVGHTHVGTLPGCTAFVILRLPADVYAFAFACTHVYCMQFMTLHHGLRLRLRRTLRTTHAVAF